ncbi:MAG: ComF family protein [Oscillibacter sp.]|nr:ComF family protein [Oscillibacter sp.]
MEFRAGAIWSRFLDLLFPPKCPFCNAVLERPGICDDCAADLPLFGDGFRVIRGLYCAAPLRYEGAARSALLQLKFRGRAAVAEPLGNLLATCAAGRLSGAFDVVSYVPISRERRRQRGYNQSELLAKAACRAWGTRPEGLLVKIADNPPQSGISGAAARWSNVSGVYRPAPGHSVSGRRVLLIDDICTTGATLCECAKTLRDGGAAAVYALTVAAAGREPEKT